MPFAGAKQKPNTILSLAFSLTSIAYGKLCLAQLTTGGLMD